jgi:hypothetical protein
MPVVIFFTVKGDTPTLLAAYDRTTAEHHPSRLGHLMAGTAEGMMGVEVWSSRADLERFMADELPGIFERADALDVIPPNASFEITEVHHAYGRLAEESVTA